MTGIKGRGRVVGYIRVSTDEQVGKGGVLSQKRQIIDWCTSPDNDVLLVDWYQDLGVSGAAPLEERAQLLHAVGRVARDDLDGIVCAEPERFTREPTETAIVLSMLEATGARVFYASGGNGTGEDGKLSPTDVLIRDLMGMLGRYNRALITARVRGAKKQNVEEKGRLWTRAPYGYRQVRDERGRLAGRLEEVQIEADAVRLVFEMRAKNQTLQAIADQLNAMKAPLPGQREGQHHKRWAASAPTWNVSKVQALLLREEFYAGRKNQMGGDVVGHPALVALAEDA